MQDVKLDAAKQSPEIAVFQLSKDTANNRITDSGCCILDVASEMCCANGHIVFLWQFSTGLGTFL